MVARGAWTHHRCVHYPVNGLHRVFRVCFPGLAVAPDLADPRPGVVVGRDQPYLPDQLPADVPGEH